MPQIPEKIQELSVGQLSARSGAAVSALRFCESKGLISRGRHPGERPYTRSSSATWVSRRPEPDPWSNGSAARARPEGPLIATR